MKPKEFSKYIGKGLKLTRIVDMLNIHFDYNPEYPFGIGHFFYIDLLTKETDEPCKRDELDDDIIVGVLVCVSEYLIVTGLYIYEYDGGSGSCCGHASDEYDVDWNHDHMELSPRQLVAFLDIADRGMVDAKQFNFLFELSEAIQTGLSNLF